MWKKKRERVETKIDPSRNYSNMELNDIADQLLLDYAKEEYCGKCNENKRSATELGLKTGKFKRVMLKDREGVPLVNDDGNIMYANQPQYTCKKGHKWFQGEGYKRGNDGDNPVLFDTHLEQRRKREIYTANGVPDPEIVSGLYYRTHPQGRKVNTEEQRRKSGAAFYRG